MTVNQSLNCSCTQAAGQYPITCRGTSTTLIGAMMNAVASKAWRWLGNLAGRGMPFCVH